MYFADQLVSVALGWLAVAGVFSMVGIFCEFFKISFQGYVIFGGLEDFVCKMGGFQKMGSEICSITVTSAVVVVTVTPRVISKSGGKDICRLDFRI